MLHTKYRPTKFNEVIGHEEIIKSIGSLMNKDMPHAFLFSGSSGCVDAETEFLTDNGWKKISAYEQNDLVAQYKDGKIELIKPLDYIKLPCDYLWEFSTKYGVNQCLSDEHRVLYISKKGKQYVKQFSEIKKIHEESKYGFSGGFITTFSPQISTNYPIKDEELRLMIAVIADGHFPRKTNYVSIRLKKQRKIERLLSLLSMCKIEYKIKDCLPLGFKKITFYSPIKIKSFDLFWKSSLKQLKIINDEVLFWDGDQKNTYFTTNKGSADFIQYVFSSCGYRSTICEDNHKEGTLCYVVHRTDRTLAHFCKETKINKLVPKDGFKYCFTVPSSFLVLRRQDRIFITGNCGKTTIARLIATVLNPDGNGIIEINVANSTGIDYMRQINEEIKYSPLIGNNKIYILDEVQQLSKEGMNCILKMLEDSPKLAYFILCTTEINKILLPIRNRCIIYNLKPLADKDISELLKRVSKEEKINLSEDILNLLIYKAEGIPRSALVYLNQVKNIKDFDEATRILETDISQEEDVIELCRILIKNPKPSWLEVIDLFNKITIEPESIRIVIAGYLAGCLKKKASDKHAEMLSLFLSPLTFGSQKSELIYLLYKTWSL